MWPFASALVLGAYLHPSRVFTNRIAYGLGVISFGLYAWHGLVANLVIRFGGLTRPWSIYLATVAGSIALATLSYRWIEVPGIRCGHWLASRITRRERVRDASRFAGGLAPAADVAS